MKKVSKEQFRRFNDSYMRQSQSKLGTLFTEGGHYSPVNNWGGGGGGGTRYTMSLGPVHQELMGDPRVRRMTHGHSWSLVARPSAPAHYRLQYELSLCAHTVNDNVLAQTVCQQELVILLYAT